MKDDEIGTNDASRLIHVSPTTLQRWIDAGHIPARRTIGGHRKMRRSDLLAFAHKEGIRSDEKKVLIVDDDRDLLDTLGVFIRGARPDLGVLRADSAFAAGFYIHRDRPTLLLLDIRMPTVDGIEVCRIVKSDPATAAIRVVGLTASRDPAEVAALREAGAEEVHFKPFDRSALRELLDRVFPPAAAARSAR